MINEPTPETHIPIKICHGTEVVSPILFILKSKFTPKVLINKLLEHNFVNEECLTTYNSNWFENLKQGSIVLGMVGSHTLFNKSLQLIPFPDMKNLDPQ